jgi:hypothetical protein
MKISEKNKKRLFIVLMGVSFIAIYIYNVLTPQMSDELQFDASLYNSVLDIIKLVYQSYMTWNGRSVVQFIMNCFLMTPKWFFNIMNSFCFVLLTVLMYLNIEGRKKYDCFIYLLINLAIWQFGVSFDQTILWESGACNYLWGAVIILGFVTLYRYKLNNIDSVKHGRILAILLFIFGIMAGWCNENTSGGGILLVLLALCRYIFYSKENGKTKIKSWMISGLIGMLCGFGMMVMAPGNSIRTEAVTEDENTGVLAIVGRFLKINTAVETYLFMLLVVAIILCCYLILKNHTLISMINAIFYAVASIATAYVLILTATPMDRAYFGASLFMIIACVQMIAYIPDDEVGLQAIKYGGIIAFAIFMFFSYCENGADLMRIRRELNEREEYILEQMAEGNYDLTVPMLRPEFETKYSFIYLNDVDEDPESWGSQIYKNYYGLNSLVGIPREDWTEY